MMTDQELNEQVARKLGHKLLQHPDSGEWKIRQNDGPKMFYLVNIPDYCHSIQAAWEVVEKMRTGYEINLTGNKQNWQAWIIGPTWKQGHRVQADTAPLAICEAFLKLPWPSRIAPGERYGA